MYVFAEHKKNVTIFAARTLACWKRWYKSRMESHSVRLVENLAHKTVYSLTYKT